MTTALLAIKAEAEQENKNYKLVLIDDIIRAKKFLYGQGRLQHNEFLNDKAAADLFDELYDLDILCLEIVYKSYEKQMNECLHSLVSNG